MEGASLHEGSKDEAQVMLMEITGVDAKVADTLINMCSLEEAIELASAPEFDPSLYGGSTFQGRRKTDEELAREWQHQGADFNDLDDVRAPIPSKRERLYEPSVELQPSLGHRMLHRRETNSDIHAFQDEREKGDGRHARMKRSEGASTSSSIGLGTLFQAPKELMFKGNFQEAFQEAQERCCWLLLNLQSNEEFASHQLNRDTWTDNTLKNLISTAFLFFQCVDTSETGAQVQSNYRLYTLPAIVVVDPITGSAMHVSTGFQSPERLMETLVPYMDTNPDHPDAQKLANMHKLRSKASNTQSKPKAKTEEEEMEEAIRLSMGDNCEKAELLEKYETSSSQSESSEEDDNDTDRPSGPPEPSKITKAPEVVQQEALNSLTPSEPSQACRVRLRLPAGSLVTHTFLKTAPVSELRMLCIASSIDAASGREFSLFTGRPGCSEPVRGDGTFEEAGIANSVVSMAWK